MVFRPRNLNCGPFPPAPPPATGGAGPVPAQRS